MKKAQRSDKSEATNEPIRELGGEELESAAGGWYDFIGNWNNANPYGIPNSWHDMYSPSGGGGYCY
jgi:hypothetical protein